MTNTTLKNESFTVDDEAAKICVERTCSREDADGWVASGSSFYSLGKRLVTNPEFEGYSWADVNELRSILAHYGEKAEKMNAVLLSSAVDIVARFDEKGIDARAVYWFLF